LVCEREIAASVGKGRGNILSDLLDERKTAVRTRNRKTHDTGYRTIGLRWDGVRKSIPIVKVNLAVIIGDGTASVTGGRAELSWRVIRTLEYTSRGNRNLPRQYLRPCTYKVKFYTKIAVRLIIRNNKYILSTCA